MEWELDRYTSVKLDTMPNQTQFESASSASDVEFRNPETAARGLERMRRFAPPGVCESLAQLLPELPDADSAVTQFERLVEGGSPDLVRLLEKHRFLVHYAACVFSYSPWLGETLIQNPDLFESLWGDQSLDRTHSREDFQESFGLVREAADETDRAALLGWFKRCEYVRILLRDVLGIATLAQTTSEISGLADMLVEEAVREVSRELEQRYGAPQHFDTKGRLVKSRLAVLSLGKLGGNELNYSSDIDLLFVYEDGEEGGGAGGGISNREYFIRLAQQATELLSRHTREGPVFRIDLRLRPLGHEGEPAVPFSYAVRYYAEVAQDWELQAMIKARHSAGDRELAQRFIQSLQPHVYRPELNFAAIKTALLSREKIRSRRRRKPGGRSGERDIDVKLDGGGIRDIEFLVQCLQRVYGGGESWLRSSGTLFALQKLYDKQHISGEDFQSLTSAYEFLRTLEHRLQLRQGRQVHRLPRLRRDLQCVARSLVRPGAVAPTAEQFLAAVRSRMAAVAQIYERVIYQEQRHSSIDLPSPVLTPEPLGTPESSYSQILQRLAVDSPELSERITRAELSLHARRNLYRFLNSAATTAGRYAAVLDAPAAVEKACKIFEHSEYLSDILIRYPKEVAWVGRISEIWPEGGKGLGIIGSENHPDGMTSLRMQYRRGVLMAGARDLDGPRDVFTSLRDTTMLAEAAIQSGFQIAGASDGLAVMALGRLGSREFDVLSDADLLLVREELVNPQKANRTAQQIVDALTAYTREGTVFPVDTRLRPHGRAGELVITPGQLAKYLSKEAQPWEALTYLKLRFVAGDAELGAQTLEAAGQGISSLAKRAAFEPELLEMRRRIEQSETLPSFKSGPGGAYDLDFLLGMLQARHQLWLAGNLRERLRLAQAHGLLEEEEYAILNECALLLRTVEHLVRLVTGRSRKWLPVAEHEYRTVQTLLNHAVGGDGEPEQHLGRVLQPAREIYLKYCDR